jgi:O-antigen/teichoic acid export membrane protein
VNELLRSVMAFAAGSGAAALVNFAALSIYTRLLVPASYGRYALVTASVAAMSAIVFQWLRASVRRFGVPGGEHEPAALWSALMPFYLILWGGAAAVAITLAVLHLFPLSLIGLGLALLLAQSSYELVADFAVANGSARTYGTMALGRALIALALGGGLAWAGFGERGVLLGIIAGGAIPAVLVGFGSWRGRFCEPARRADVRRLLLRYGLPFTMSIGLQFVLDSSDRFLLGHFAGTAAVGTYAAAYDLTQQSLSFLLMTVNLAAFPAAVRAFQAQGAAGAQGSLAHQATLLLAIGVPATVGLVLLSRPLSSVLFGADFRAAASQIMPVIAVGILLSGIRAYYFDLAFQLTGRTRILVGVVGVGALLNLVLNLWWIPRSGAMGAAWATAVTYLATLVISVVAGRSVMPMPTPWSQTLRIGVATGAMGLVVSLMPSSRSLPGVAGLGIAGLLVYAVAAAGANVGGARPALVRALPWSWSRAPR